MGEHSAQTARDRALSRDVVIPARHVGELAKLIARALLDQARSTGEQPTPAARDLLVALADAARHPVEPLSRPSFENETRDNPAPTMEISTDAAAHLLGCSAQYVRRLCRAGQLQGRRIGRAWLITQRSLDTYRFQAKETKTCSEPKTFSGRAP